MLTAEQNEELTQVAAGTPMGELLRRYWYPVAFTRELEEFPIKAARLLGEDFAVFKTPRGRYGMRDIGWTELPCNFVQIMENAVDPHHTEWLHGRFFEFMARHQGFDAPASFGKKHVKVGFDAFEWGIIKRRVVEGASEEDDDWKIGHPLVFPYNMRVGGANIEQMQIRVPIDRTTTRFMLYTTHAPEGVEYPAQPLVPDYQIPVYDADGRHRVDYVEGQDMMAWVTQGPITDRTVEPLGRSDV